MVFAAPTHAPVYHALWHPRQYHVLGTHFLRPQSTPANARQEFGRLRRRVHLIHLHVHGAEPLDRAVLPEVPHGANQGLLRQHTVLDDCAVAIHGLLVVAVVDPRFGQHHGLPG